MNWDLFVFVLIFQRFSKIVDVCDCSFCGEGAVIWIENVGENLGYVIGVCNVVCAGCWWWRGDVVGVKIVQVVKEYDDDYFP